jgi:hypothetical protein
MHLPLFFYGLPGASPLRPALQAAAVVAAAVAGYVTFLPLTQRPDPTGLPVAQSSEQPPWAGHIERPDLDAPAPSAPVTSASYVLPEAGSIDNPSKRDATAIAIIPKVPGKPVLPPRRPSADEALRTVAPGASPAPGTPVPPAPIPVAVAASETPAKPVSRNVFSPVTDHLPTTATLMKPFRAVGDAFHNLIKSF